LLDGVIRYKRKWGSTLYGKRDVLHSTLVHWDRLDGVVAEFLAHTPLIFRDGEGLSAVARVQRDEPWTCSELLRARERLWISGLRTLTLIAEAHAPADLSLPADIRLLDFEALRGAGPRAVLNAARAKPPRGGG
jgi:hypothetical protein